MLESDTQVVASQAVFINEPCKVKSNVPKLTPETVILVDPVVVSKAEYASVMIVASNVNTC